MPVGASGVDTAAAGTQRRLMKAFSVRVFACLAVATLALPAAAQTLKFEDLAGWWTAEPSFGGESSRVALHFLEADGKREARVSVLAIGGYDFPIGEVTIS